VAFGTFGELLQGMLEDDSDFLVTFPISRSSRATFRLSADSTQVGVSPVDRRKAALLATRVLRHFGYQEGGLLELTGDLPVGKGLASSSADLVATARAVAGALGVRLDEAMIESFLRDIEPTDGVMYSGIVSYHHRAVRLRRRLGFLPPLTIVAHDEGGTVDTVDFNRLAKPFSSADKAEYGCLLDRLTDAVRVGDLRAIGRIATRSAEMNEKLRPRDDFETMRRICQEVDGLGLVLTHSGTNLGILLAEDWRSRSGRVEHARRLCSALAGTVEVHRSLGLEDYWAASPVTYPVLSESSSST
jgi:L-threonine kinase